jgi:ribosomal RNA-processing protein 7
VNCSTFDLIERSQRISIMAVINGYTVIPLLVSSDDEEPVFHMVYARKHQSRDSSSDCIVFITNLPVDTTLANIKELGQAFGNTIVEDFEHDDKESRGLITFVDKTACQRFLSKAKSYDPKTNPVKWTSFESSGRQRYLELHREKYIGREVLQENVDEYMEQFFQLEEERELEVQQMAGQVDDEGFTLVVGSKRKSKGGIANAKAVSQEVMANQANKKRKKEKTDFYRFQIRDQKKLEMNALLKKFQEDKEKIKEMREKKRFRPY